jgi:hypothetical protein
LSIEWNGCIGFLSIQFLKYNFQYKGNFMYLAHNTVSNSTTRDKWCIDGRCDGFKLTSQENTLFQIQERLLVFSSELFYYICNKKEILNWIIAVKYKQFFIFIHHYNVTGDFLNIENIVGQNSCVSIPEKIWDFGTSTEESNAILTSCLLPLSYDTSYVV